MPCTATDTVDGWLKGLVIDDQPRRFLNRLWIAATHPGYMTASRTSDQPKVWSEGSLVYLAGESVGSKVPIE